MEIAVLSKLLTLLILISSNFKTCCSFDCTFSEDVGKAASINAITVTEFPVVSALSNVFVNIINLFNGKYCTEKIGTITDEKRLQQEANFATNIVKGYESLLVNIGSTARLVANIRRNNVLRGRLMRKVNRLYEKIIVDRPRYYNDDPDIFKIESFAPFGVIELGILEILIAHEANPALKELHEISYGR